MYTAILAVLAAGAAYVPVESDDPDERARTEFREAGVARVLTEGDLATLRATAVPRRPGLDDDAWIIFTSAPRARRRASPVTHRSAAAFVDAESRLFLQGSPRGPGDACWPAVGRVRRQLRGDVGSVGARRVPGAGARALVRTGMDLGPWLVAQAITVISTVPTLAGLWRAEELSGVRLLIFGGEACPPELVARLVGDGREVWNTYGPTEATVVGARACSRPTDPCGSGGRWTAGTSRSSRPTGRRSRRAASGS